MIETRIPKDHGPDPHAGESAEIIRRGRIKAAELDAEVKATAARVRALVEANDAKQAALRMEEETWQ